MANQRPNCLTCGKPTIACASGWACPDLACSSRLIGYGRNAQQIENVPADLNLAESADELDDDALGDCPYCDGEGLVTCDECDGTGEEHCFTCGRDHDCDECGGDGELECRDCHGTGWIAKRIPERAKK